MTNSPTYKKSVTYLIKEAKCDPFQWLHDYCIAIPAVAKNYINNAITCIEDVPSSTEIYGIIEYFRGFSSIINFHLYGSNSDIRYRHTALWGYSDDEIDSFKNKIREMTRFFDESNRYTYCYKGPKRGDNHPIIVDEDGVEKPIAIFDNPLECFVGSLGHTFNAMCTMLYFMSKHEDKEKYARYAALARYVFKSFYDVYYHIGIKQFNENIPVYIIPEQLMCLHKYAANNFSYIDPKGRETIYWYRDKMYEAKWMWEAFKQEEILNECKKVKIW